MHIIRSKLLAPLLALALTVVAIAAVWTLVGDYTTARDAQLQINSLTLAVTDLESAPFRADPRAGGSPSAIKAEIAADEQTVLRGLAPSSQIGVRPSLLVTGRSDLIGSEPVITSVFRTAVSPGLSATDPALISMLQSRLTAGSATLLVVLDEISRADADRAAAASTKTKVGAAVAMLLLLIAFAFFYIRSAVARLAVERLGDDARAAAAANAVARDEAVEASNAKSMFIATVSHELRTPLTGVIGMSELLLDSKLDPQQREYAHLSRSSAESLLLVINDILDYSKIEAGKIELDPTDFSLRETIAEACAMLLVSAREKGIEIVVDIDTRLPAWLHGDAARLRQILLNLVSNAVKFTAKGTVTVTVTATPLAGATHVRVDVTDTGIGIDPVALPRLFQPFAQADNSTARRYGGTGLGLTISARLIEAMDGTIDVFSTPGKGSTFRVEFSLPAAGIGESHGHAVPDRGIQIEPNSLGSTPLVLVAEDNPVNQIIAARTLERIGCEAELVSDGREALAAIQRTTYAAVLMDCQMPVMDGYDATRELRRREQGSDRHLTIIAMTAHTMPGDREKCLSAGMDDYISKPIQADLLREALVNGIAHREASMRH